MVGQVEVLVDQMAGGVPEDTLVVIADAFDVSNYLLSPTRVMFSSHSDGMKWQDVRSTVFCTPRLIISSYVFPPASRALSMFSNLWQSKIMS